MKIMAGDITILFDLADPVQLETKTGQVHVGTISSYSKDGKIAVINSGAGQKEVALSEVANLLVRTTQQSGMLMSAPRFFISGLVLAAAGTATEALQNPSERPPAAAVSTKPPFTFITFGVGSNPSV